MRSWSSYSMYRKRNHLDGGDENNRFAPGDCKIVASQQQSNASAALSFILTASHAAIVTPLALIAITIASSQELGDNL